MPGVAGEHLRCLSGAELERRGVAADEERDLEALGELGAFDFLLELGAPLFFLGSETFRVRQLAVRAR